MSTSLQLLIAFLVILSSFLLTFAAIQVFHILHELRLVLKSLNKILQNTQTLSTASAQPLTAVNQFFTQVKTLVSTTQDEIVSATPDRVVSSSPSTPAKQHRFFKRAGQMLRPN